MSRGRTAVVLLVMLSLLLPAAGPAQAAPLSPSPAQQAGPDGAPAPPPLPRAFLFLDAQDDGSPCNAETLRYTLDLAPVLDISQGTFTGAINVPMPFGLTYIASSGAPAPTFDGSSNTLQWVVPFDPANPGPSLPQAIFTATIGSVVANGAVVTTTATGLLNAQPITASHRLLINCDENNFATADPDAAPPLQAVEDPAVDNPVDTPSMVQSAQLTLTLPFTDSSRSEPAFGDANPPGFANPTFIPQAFGPQAPLAAGQTLAGDSPLGEMTPDFDIPPIVGEPTCDYAYPWAMQHRMSEATYTTSAIALNDANFRPVSISGNGAGADTRYSHIWRKDNKYGKQWSIRHNMTSAEYQSQVDLLKAQGLWPYVIDIHGTTASPRYAAIWYKDTAVAARHDRSQTEFTQDIADQAAAGRRPVWVSALGNPANEEPLFAGIWVKDAYTGTMRINLTSADIGAEGLARSLTDQGFRLVNLSAYETSEGTRYAGVWIKGGPCPNLRWEGFRDQTSSALQIKASAQRQVSAVKSLAAGTITLTANDLGGSFRTARVAVTHNFPQPEPELGIIATNPANLAQNGDILVLQAQPGKNLIVRQLANGNIRLRNIDPNNASVGGQPFVFSNHTHRLVLQYSAASQKWVELQRNGISPDYYFATSLDEYGPANARRYNSVWQAGPSQRRWTVTGRPAGSDPLAILDVVMQQYMQRRNLPNAVLAISRNGAPVFARGYSWDLPGVAAAPPGLPMRLASVSKPLTAIAILRLVQNNQLNLDTHIKDIPNFGAVLNAAGWSDDRIDDVTVRMLLHHLGGWDRDITTDNMLNDFAVCNLQNPKTLPTTLPAILTFQRTQSFNRDPGTSYAYSNFGYALLGLIIEAVTGKPYGQYVDEVVLNPVGANDTFLGGNSGGPGEAIYYRPNAAMGASVVPGAFPAPNPATVCNASYALSTHVALGTFNILPMAAHGGWVASAPDLVKVFDGVEDGALINAATRELMWARPAGRSRRVVAFDGATTTYNDRTLRAFKTNPEQSFAPIDDKGDLLIVGRGLNRWGKISVEVETPGAGYDLVFMYVGAGALKVLSNDEGLNDGTAGFTRSGSITFDAPLDWRPASLGVGDPEPRHYLLILSKTKPTTPATFKVFLPSGEADYALGWSSVETSIKLDFTNGALSLAPGMVIRGTKSLAMATITAKTGTAGGTLTLTGLVNGPFRAGETFVNMATNNVVGKTTGRDRAATASSNHGGLLWGNRAWLVHRTDGVNFAVLFNQDSTYDPYWYLPSEGTGALSKAMDTLTQTNSWP